jgi:hypothetical protein
MLKTMEKAKKTLSWLFEKPLANTISSLYILDRAMITLLKITFIMIRIFSRITFQKIEWLIFNFKQNVILILKSTFPFICLCFSIKLLIF